MANETGIRPALTVDEWEQRARFNADGDARFVLVGRGFDGYAGHAHLRDADEVPIAYEGDFHALAALALYGQPFGFTEGDVNLLRLAAQMEEECFGDERGARHFTSIADRIAALLPPHA